MRGDGEFGSVGKTCINLTGNFKEGHQALIFLLHHNRSSYSSYYSHVTEEVEGLFCPAALSRDKPLANLSYETR